MKRSPDRFKPTLAIPSPLAKRRLWIGMLVVIALAIAGVLTVARRIDSTPAAQDPASR